MQKMTSAYANKLLKSLEEEKLFWVNKERCQKSKLLEYGLTIEGE